MKLCIIGLGLIGGSMAIDLKKRKYASHIIGVDINPLHSETAKRLGIIDELASLEQGVKQADLIILATPANASLKLLPEVLDLVEDQMVTDVCSIKENICKIVEYHPKRKQYVAAHPMAGTEHSGPWAAQSNLFDGKAVIIAEAERSELSSVQEVKKLFNSLHMHLVYMSAANHDIHVAYVSHISHISSFALALTVLEKEENEKNIFDLASGGFDSTVRLAKSSHEMWVPIFDQNSDNIITVLDNYISQINKFKEKILSKETGELSDLIIKANHIKKILRA
jgi:prephenate dehydrogenase